MLITLGESSILGIASMGDEFRYTGEQAPGGEATVAFFPPCVSFEVGSLLSGAYLFERRRSYRAPNLA